MTTITQMYIYIPTCPACVAGNLNAANESIVAHASGNAEIKIHGLILPDLNLALSIKCPMTKSATIEMNFAAKIMTAMIIKFAPSILLKNSA